MILTAGEALIDMVADHRQGQRYTAFPGGSAYNVACALGLLGVKTGFVCPISQDNLGTLLLNRLLDCGVKPMLSQRVAEPTPMALVSVNSNSQPSYAFYRQGTSDRTLAQFDMAGLASASTQILHITGFCLNDIEDYQHWMKLVRSVKASGGLVSVDPNVRATLIVDADDYRARLRALMALADIVKISDEDLAYLFPEVTLEQAKYTVAEISSLVIVTLGSKGAEAFWCGQYVRVEAFCVDPIIDTVGAGDCFSAAYLYGLHSLGLRKSQLNSLSSESLSSEQLSSILRFAAIAAGINCGRQGCQPPTVAEIEASVGPD